MRQISAFLMLLERRLDPVTLKARRMLFWFFMVGIIDDLAVNSSVSCKNKSPKS